MPLAKIIHDHIDETDDLEADFNKEFESMFNKLGERIDDIIDNPRDIFLQFVEEIKTLIEEKYSVLAIDMGIRIAKKFEDLDKKIVIQDSDDPNLNIDQLDVDRNG